MFVLNVDVASDSVKSEVTANHTSAASIAFGIAAIPALFLPFSYIFMCAWAVINIIFPAASGNYTEAHPIDLSLLILGGGYYGTLIQWPFYMIWVAFSKELNWRLRLVWIVILFLFNMFAIPWFLYCKYRGITKTIIVNNVGLHWLRAWLEKDALPLSRSLQEADFKQHNIGFVRLLITMGLLLSVLFYVNYKLLIGNLVLRSTEKEWAVIAGDSLANKDFAKGQISFYEIDLVDKAGTVIKARDGYPVKAWFQVFNGYEESSPAFIDAYNKTMLRLIKSKDASK